MDLIHFRQLNLTVFYVRTQLEQVRVNIESYHIGEIANMVAINFIQTAIFLRFVFDVPKSDEIPESCLRHCSTER